MKNSDMPAMPQSEEWRSQLAKYSRLRGDRFPVSPPEFNGSGLTKREMFAMHIMAGLAADSECVGSAELDLVDEIVKRINLHEKLIILLKESKFALSQQYGVDSMFLDEVNNVLEQCK